MSKAVIKNYPIFLLLTFVDMCFSELLKHRITQPLHLFFVFSLCVEKNIRNARAEVCEGCRQYHGNYESDSSKGCCILSSMYKAINRFWFVTLTDLFCCIIFHFPCNRPANERYSSNVTLCPSIQTRIWSINPLLIDSQKMIKCRRSYLLQP